MHGRDRALTSVVLLLLLPLPCWCWSINTHMHSANIILKDIEDDGAIQLQEVIRHDDGTVTVQPLGDPIPIPADFAAAILAAPDAFRAGSCGPDGYPDIYVGQSVIHPYVPGQPWRATDWARQVLKKAPQYDDGDFEQQEALAYAAGWLVHYAGDAFGHTWVNSYAGGEWDWGDLNIVKKHVTVESFVNAHIPHEPEGIDNVYLEMVSGFPAHTLILDDDVQEALAPAGYLQSIVDYYRAFRKAEKKCEDRQEEWWNPVGWGIDAVEDWLEHYRKESDRALSEWVETSTVVLRHMAEKHPERVPGELGEWAIEYPARLCPFIPKQIIDVIGWIGHEITWVMSPVSKLQDSIAQWVYENTIKDTVDAITNAENLMNEFYGPAIIAQVEEEMGVTDDHPSLNLETFKPLYDTVMLGKLTLLDADGLKRFSEVTGIADISRGKDDRILWDCINSLDKSNQLSLYPPFRLLETEELKENVFRRLFMTDPYEAPPSRIDPAHLVSYLTRTDREVAFIIPVTDPGHDRARVIASVYQKREGSPTLHRVPFFEQAIPTIGQPGACSACIIAKYQAPRYGTYKFHLCTADAQPDSNELLEDRGIDVQVNIFKQDTLPAGIIPPLPGGAGTGALPGGAPPAGLPPGGAGTAGLPPGMPNPQDMLAAQRNMARLILEGATAALQSPNLPADLRAQIQQQQKLAQETLDRLNAMDPGTLLPPTATVAPPPEADDQGGIFPPDMVDGLRKLAAGEMPGGDDPEIAARQRKILTDGHFALGLLCAPDGTPLPNATVTLVEEATYALLRKPTGVPQVRLDQWRPILADMLETSPDGRYFFGRTNANGEYVIPNVPDGTYRLIASAPGYGKLVQQIEVSMGEALLIDLPQIAAVPPEESSTEGQYRERQFQPDFTVSMSPREITFDDAQRDGTVRATIFLRPLAGFSGTVTLSLEGIPDEARASLSETIVALNETPRMVSLVMRPRRELADRAVGLLRARSGEIEHETEFLVSLAGGRFLTEPPDPVLKAGDRTTVRLLWEGNGPGSPAVMLSLGKLPPEVWVKADTIRPHEHVAPLKLTGLTLEKAEDARQSLRVIADVPVVPRPERPPLTVDRIARGPVEAPVKGIWLAPGGWADLTIAIGAGVPEGALKLPVTCRIGNLEIQEAVTLQVTK
jgi:hypothetical protein